MARQGKMKSTKQLSSEAAFGPKIGRGEVDQYSPGNYVAQFPVRHKAGMQKTLTTALAIDFTAGKMGSRIPQAERIGRMIEGGKERLLGGLTGELVRQTRKLRAQNQADKRGKKSKTAPK